MFKSIELCQDNSKLLIKNSKLPQHTVRLRKYNYQRVQGRWQEAEANN
jgi:hypothetical protein